MLASKLSFSFDNHQQGSMGQNFNRSEPSLKDIVQDQLGWTQKKSKKMAPTSLVKEEEKAEVEVEAQPRSKKEEQNIGKASPKDICNTHLLPCSAAILDDLPN
jgi:DNA recombination-dependent growth factor C